jgi:hypothetical protein
VKIIYRQIIGGTLVLHDVYFPEYRPDRVVDDRFPILLDDDHIYLERFSVQEIFKFKTETAPGVQGRLDNVAKGGMPNDRFVLRFIVFVCDDLFLLLADFMYKIVGSCRKKHTGRVT